MIKPDPKKKEVDGILLAQDDEIQTFYAEVVAIGKERPDEPIDCKKGDKIVYNKWSSNKITHDGTEYHFLRTTDILGVVE